MKLREKKSPDLQMIFKTIVVVVCLGLFVYAVFTSIVGDRGSVHVGSASFGFFRRLSVGNGTTAALLKVSLKLFPVGGENETDGRIVDQLKWMEIDNKTRTEKNRTRKTKVILGVGGFNREDWIEGFGRFDTDKCQVRDCRLTSDIAEAKTADALLISQIGWSSVKHYLPKPTHQIWIAKHMESPMHNRIDPSSLRGLVNWTLTYRPSSTIFYPYILSYGPRNRIDPKYWYKEPVARPPGPDGRYSSVNYAAGKTKKVAWFVTNCADRNGRLNYARELSKYIDVDIYGHCGKLRCERSRADCRQMLSNSYKFYLAFENSNCVEYITEKFTYQALLTDVLPIVMGARPEDYAAFAPPKSFIHVDEFSNPKHLAEYLHRLDKNDTLYNEYFRWKDTWVAYDDRRWCRICAMLHAAEDFRYVSSFPGYPEWWNGACSSRWADHGQRWHTWRPAGFWESRNITSTIDHHR